MLEEQLSMQNEVAKFKEECEEKVIISIWFTALAMYFKKKI